MDTSNVIDVEVASNNDVYFIGGKSAGVSRIKKISVGSGTATPIAEGYPFNSLGDIELDSAGNIYVVDPDKDQIFKITPLGDVTVLAGIPMDGYGGEGFSGDGGSALLAQFNRPMGLAVDSSGNIFVADSKNHRIRKVSCVAAPVESDKDPAKKFYEEEQHRFIHPSIPVEKHVLGTRKTTRPKIAPKWLLPKARVR